MSGRDFLVEYKPGVDIEKLEILFRKYKIDIVRHQKDKRLFNLKVPDTMHEQIRKVWISLFENEMIQFVYPELHVLFEEEI